MLADPRVRKLSFTGSTEVGRTLLAEAAKHVVSCSMELGGNAPFVVFDDADLDAALDGAMVAKMRNAGEACTAANRFYVQAGIYDAFARRPGRAHGGAARWAPAPTPATECGPMINAKAVEKIDRLVDDAVARGAKVLTGGKRLGQGYYYPPTVLGRCPGRCRDGARGNFRPGGAGSQLRTEDEAIALRQRHRIRPRRLHLHPGSRARACASPRKIEAGMVGLNRGLVSDPAAPFGGVKQSGLGREGGQHHGILEFMEAKYIAISI